MNRRVITRRRISLPAQGKSATCLSYRLWIRRDLAPHNGHPAMPLTDLTDKIIESDESLTLSITNPLGTSDEIRMPARMADSPVGEPQARRKNSSNVSQSQYCRPNDIWSVSKPAPRRTIGRASSGIGSQGAVDAAGPGEALRQAAEE